VVSELPNPTTPQIHLLKKLAMKLQREALPRFGCCFGVRHASWRMA
jgi:hypothetical protein